MTRKQKYEEEAKSLALHTQFSANDWQKLCQIADEWMSKKSQTLPPPAIYQEMATIVKKFPKEIKKSNDQTILKYREFVLFHTRKWDLFWFFCNQTDDLKETNGFNKPPKFPNNIKIWNKKIEDALKTIDKQGFNHPDTMEAFITYASNWVLVKCSGNQPSATYHITKELRNAQFSRLLIYLMGYKQQAQKDKAKSVKYLRVYFYLHFHTRDWQQYQQLALLPQP